MKRFAVLAAVGWMACTTVFAANPFAGKTDDEIAAQIDTVVANKVIPDGFESALTKVVTNPDAGIRARERAAWALGELEYKPGVPALLNAADHKGLLIRSAALGSLARLRPLEALPVFVRVAQSDPILQLRQRATIALGSYRSDKAIDPLVKLSSDPTPEIRGAAALAMAMTHSKKNDFTEVLTEMEGDENPYVKERATRGLEIIHGKTAEVMTALKTGDQDVRFTAAIHLEKAAGNKELEGLKEAWTSEADEDVRAQIQRSIVATKKRVAAEKKASAAKAAAATPAKKTGAHKKHTKKAGTVPAVPKAPAAPATAQ